MYRIKFLKYISLIGAAVIALTPKLLAETVSESDKIDNDLVESTSNKTHNYIDLYNYEIQYCSHT